MIFFHAATNSNFLILMPGLLYFFLHTVHVIIGVTKIVISLSFQFSILSLKYNPTMHPPCFLSGMRPKVIENICWNNHYWMSFRSENSLIAYTFESFDIKWEVE